MAGPERAVGSTQTGSTAGAAAPLPEQPRAMGSLRAGWRAQHHRLVRTVAASRRAWRRSLQLRMVTITLLVSGVLVGAFGYLVVELTTRSLLATVDRDAVEQVSRDAERVRANLHTLGPSNHPLLTRELRQAIEPLANSPDRGQAVTVALVTAPEVAGAIVVPEPDVEITSMLSEQLQQSVSQGVSRQIITGRLYEGQPEVTYLVYGSPVPTAWPGQDTALYHFFPLTSAVDAAKNIRTIVLATGATLVLLLAVVTGLVTRLVVRPVRVAARTAQRLSAGLLDQRMAVRGEDDLALLGASFNQMAGNLQRQIVRLEEMSRLQRRFTSDVSHELRTPLTTVRMAADLIFSERGSYPPAVARSAELLQHELDRFESLLTELLEISRFDAGFAALDSELTDLVPVVRRAVDRLSAIRDRAGTELWVSLPDQPVIAEVDPRRVDRIVRNLVENAIEHCEGRPVEVTLAADDSAAALTVRDYGVGLRPDERKLVFNRFWRADPARARGSGGTGLGLSISLEDARLHGGWLEAWGVRGHGSQFRLTLPVRAGEPLVGSPLPLRPLDAPADPDGQPDPDGPAADAAVVGGPVGGGPVLDGPVGSGAVADDGHVAASATGESVAGQTADRVASRDDGERVAGGANRAPASRRPADDQPTEVETTAGWSITTGKGAGQ